MTSRTGRDIRSLNFPSVKYHQSHDSHRITLIIATVRALPLCKQISGVKKFQVTLLMNQDDFAAKTIARP
jgi:hypothetical protein